MPVEARDCIQWVSVLNVYKSTYEGLLDKGLLVAGEQAQWLIAIICCSIRGPGFGSSADMMAQNGL